MFSLSSNSSSGILSGRQRGRQNEKWELSGGNGSEGKSGGKSV